MGENNNEPKPISIFLGPSRGTNVPGTNPTRPRDKWDNMVRILQLSKDWPFARGTLICSRDRSCLCQGRVWFVRTPFRSNCSCLLFLSCPKERTIPLVPLPQDVDELASFLQWAYDPLTLSRKQTGIRCQVAMALLGMTI